MLLFNRTIHHPNISVLLEVEKIDSRTAIITPLVRGSNLQDVIFNDCGVKVKHETLVMAYIAMHY